MRIVHLTSPAGFGGLEQVVKMLATGLIARGHEVTVGAVVHPGSPQETFISSLAEAGIEVVPMSIGRRDYPLEMRLVRNLLRERGAQIAHTHGYRADVIDGFAARSLGVPRVSTVHGFIGGIPLYRFYEWVEERFLRRFSAVVAVAVPIRDRLIRSGIPDSTVHLVPNAVSPSIRFLDRNTARARLGIDASAFAVGWIGRLSAEKGPDVMLDAAHALRDANISTHFVGDGPMRAALEQRTHDTGLASTVQFHGVISSASEYLRAFDMLVLTSRTEGTPIVILEGMAAGVPIVATAVGGVPHVLSQREAMLIPEVDGTQVAKAIVALRGDVATRESLAAAANERLERELNYDRWISSYERIYQSLMVNA